MELNKNVSYWKIFFLKELFQNNEFWVLTVSFISLSYCYHPFVWGYCLHTHKSNTLEGWYNYQSLFRLLSASIITYFHSCIRFNFEFYSRFRYTTPKPHKSPEFTEMLKPGIITGKKSGCPSKCCFFFFVFFSMSDLWFLTRAPSLALKVSPVAGVRCNYVRHAILSAPDTFAYAIVSGAMQKPSGGLVQHECARVKRACMH